MDFRLCHGAKGGAGFHPHGGGGAADRIARAALEQNRQIFVFGNGGSAANASHFVTDLGKGASDKVGRRFRCLSLNDNVSWMTAMATITPTRTFLSRQLENYGRKGDLVLALSVSGNSPNVVKALAWAEKAGLNTIALVGAKRGEMARIARHVIVIDSVHYGRVEDAQMADLPHALLRLHGESRNGGGRKKWLVASGEWQCRWSV